MSEMCIFHISDVFLFYFLHGIVLPCINASFEVL